MCSLYEHHSNLLPWRESGAEVVLIDELDDGTIDLKQLESKLVHFSKLGFKIIGSFCAASHITGQLNDDLVNFKPKTLIITSVVQFFKSINYYKLTK